LEVESASQNILIIRTSALGDIVHALPVLTALKRHFPRARVGWVVEKVFAPLLAGHPQIDQVVEVRMRGWRKSPFSPQTRREIATAHRAIREFGADTAFDLMGNHKSGFLARMSGARRRVGAAKAGRREPSSAVWINEPVPVQGRHAVDRGLSLLAAFGIVPEAADFGPEHILSDVPAAAHSFLEGRERPYVLIQAGAGWPNKTYPSAWWGQVAREIVQRTGHEVWVPIAPGEEHLAQAIVDHSGGLAQAVDAGPFAVLAALLRHSKLVLGGDTGPIHLAHALGVPVLCLIGPTDPERNGPYGTPEQVLWKRLPCSCCYKRFSNPRACLLAIAPGEVVERACDLLRNKKACPASKDAG
jgi:heptosyltransferase-1